MFDYSVVLGKLYQKLFIHSLVPCYSQRDVEIDAVISKYHQYLFTPSTHRGKDGACLATTDGPMLQETLKKLGLSDKWKGLRAGISLEGAAGLLRAWDQGDSSSVPCPLSSEKMNHIQETEQERKRQQLRDTLRVLVQDDDKYKTGSRLANYGSESGGDEGENEVEDDEEDLVANAVWNTPLEKAYCIKLVLDRIAAVAEDHLMNGHGFGFVHRKRSGEFTARFLAPLGRTRCIRR